MDALLVSFDVIKLCNTISPKYGMEFIDGWLKRKSRIIFLSELEKNLSLKINCSANKIYLFFLYQRKYFLYKICDS